MFVFVMSAWAQEEPPSNFPWEAADLHAIVLPGVDSALYKQRYNLTVGGQSVLRTRAERGNTGMQFRTEEGEYPLAYFLTCWTGREGGDVIYLCGLKSTGESILQKWVFPVQNGRWVIRYPGPTPPIGTPSPAFVPTLAVKGGGPWRWSNGLFQQGSLTQPSAPQPSISPQIVPIYEGTEGPFTSMAVDPEGRQLFLYDFTQKSLRRLALTVTGATFETLYDDADYPLLSQIASLDVRDFGAEGRKLLARRQYQQTFVGSAEVFTILSDADNDGNFETLVSYGRPTFDASPYSQWSAWKEFWRLE